MFPLILSRSCRLEASQHAPGHVHRLQDTCARTGDRGASNKPQIDRLMNEWMNRRRVVWQRPLPHLCPVMLNHLIKAKRPKIIFRSFTASWHHAVNTWTRVNKTLEYI